MPRTRLRLFPALALALALAWLAAALPLSAATITIVNANDVGSGFDDATPATPVGGNTGTTVGQQRLIAFQHAADIWASLLDSPVEIRVHAEFSPLECDATTAVLGGAGPSQAAMDFPDAPLPGTWYIVALANRIAGEDLSTSNDDIEAQFNSDLGNTGCFEGSGWYYGVDNNHGDRIDLVAVVLHELAHGLGFLTIVDDNTGEEYQGSPDAFESHIFDSSVNKRWTEMTAAERLTSISATGAVGWDGDAVRAAVPSTLDNAATLRMTAPATIAGSFDFGTASFGPTVGSPEVSGEVAAALDASDTAGPATTDACSELTNPSELAGKIALVDRGECLFVEKAARVQAAGAIAMIVANNVAGSEPPGMGGDDVGIDIPCVSVTQPDGASIRANLDAGAAALLGLDPRRRAGTGAGGRVLLYTPNPSEPGSSVSHWDTSAFPSLLMEPNLTGDLPHTVDLTLALFRDIGWRSDTVPAPASRQAVKEVGGDAATQALPPRP
jgi:hypothetical protein